MTAALADVLAEGRGVDATTGRILDAAFDQILQFGIRRTSVENVARRAGVARITIYRRYANKDELIRAMLLRESRRAFDDLDAVVADLSTADEQLAEGFVAILNTVRHHPLFQRLMATEPEVILPLVSTHGAPVIALARDYLAHYLRLAQHTGELDDFDPKAIAELVVRLTVSFLLTPESCIPLETEDDIRAFVAGYLAPIVRARS